MRLVGCATAVLGGACWLVWPFVTGDPARLVGWSGLVLLSVAWLVAGFLIASGSLVWLRAIVAVGALALAWSLVGAALAELPDKPVRAAVGAVAILIGIALVAVGSGSSRRPAGSHAR